MAPEQESERLLPRYRCELFVTPLLVLLLLLPININININIIGFALTRHRRCVTKSSNNRPVGRICASGNGSRSLRRPPLLLALLHHQQQPSLRLGLGYRGTREWGA
jgi:hypothetical protein